MEKFKKFFMNNKIIVGISGGADSMCLLYKLSAFNKDNIIAVHINHNLRGDESLRDEEFVRDVCEKLSIKFIKYDVNVEEYSRIMKMSIEEAARELRYKSFNDALKNFDAKYIFIAHNKDDVCETFLINLFRGAGIRGLKSIEHISGNVIRPLIDMSRKDIEKYNFEHDIKYINDSTNFENDYTRNKIRNELIPYIEKNINPRVKEHIYNTVNIIKEENDFVDKHICKNLNNISINEDEAIIDTSNMNDSYIIKELIRYCIDKLIGLKDITNIHINDIYKIIGRERPIKINLPKNFIAQTVKNGVKIKKNEKLMIPINNLEDKKYKNIFIKKEIKYDNKLSLCYDKVRQGNIRHRENGDYLILKSKKIKVKDYLIKRKINIFDRDELILVAVGKRVVWIERCFMDNEFIAQNGQECLVIRR